MNAMDADLTPHQRYRADLRLLAGDFPHGVFKGIRLPYRDRTPAQEALASARYHFEEALKLLEREEAIGVEGILTHTLDLLDRAERMGGLTEKQLDVRFRASVATVTLLQRLRVIETKRADAEEAIRQAKADAFPRDRKRAQLFDYKARFLADLADLLDYYDVGHTIGVSGTTLALGKPTSQYADDIAALVDLEDRPSVSTELAEAAEAARNGRVSNAWAHLHKATTELEKGR